MATIYRPSDRIEVKVDDLSFFLSPLSMSQKQELLARVASGSSAGDLNSVLVSIRMALKYTIKDVKGLIDSDGNAYKVSFDEDGYLSDDDIDGILNLEYSESINLMCMSMANKVPEEFLGADGKPLKGVSRVRKPAKKPRGKKSPN
jgi:hypothetical protein